MGERNDLRARRRGDPLPVGSAAVGVPSAEPYRYTMADLERETGISKRNIRYYITEGLLPSAKGRGVGATYGKAHLLRLKMIARFKEDHLPLDEIRKRLENLREDDLAAMLHVETAPPEDRWRRVTLHDDLELHIREPGGRNRDYEFERAVTEIIGHSSIVLDKLEPRR
jgi:DNA-binding transcriptional MerR regulator